MSNKVTPIKKPDYEATKAFSYEVTMVLQVLATDQEKAREQLDAQGGYVTSRVVKLVAATDLYNGAQEPQV